jgi:AcrR family transcriptional regulator
MASRKRRETEHEERPKSAPRSVRKIANLSADAREKRGQMRGNRRDGLATRARVLSAGAEVFARDGYEGASLRRIAETAGVDIATLKYHVGDKAALFVEIYQDGYRHFQQALGPLLLRLPLVKDLPELEREMREVLERGFDYLERHELFVRLWMFRLLEAPREVSEAEEALRSDVMSLIEGVAAILKERGLVREVDVRALALLVITGLPMLTLTARTRPSIFGPFSPEVRERFVDFFLVTLRRQMVPVDAPCMRED